ncbi:glycosyltransferase family 4 protein [Sphingorhabdus lutea]
MSYQDNELPNQNAADGHEVLIICDTYKFENARVVKTKLERKQLKEGPYLIRLPFKKHLPEKLTFHLRWMDGLYNEIAAFKPDVILYHGAIGIELLTVKRYLKMHPKVTLYVDSHEDFYNSATSFISKWILHWMLHRSFLKRALPYITKILPINISSIRFLRDFYGVPEDLLEFYPLGGKVPDDTEYGEKRARTRAALNINDNQILIVQSGKFEPRKKLAESLRAFAKVKGDNFQFRITGYFYPEVEEELNALIAADNRVQFLGWKTPDELGDILCAADLYSQPGTQSATMQMSIGMRCPVILDDEESHVPYIDGNGWLTGKNMTIEQAFADMAKNAENLDEMSRKSHAVALRLLDYKLLAARLYR